MSKFLKSAALCFAAAMAHPVLAADCEFTVGTGDMLKFDGRNDCIGVMRHG